MKKIDLHIHTKSTISDSEFIFNLSKLKEYVDRVELNAIAITNHNIFDLDQFIIIEKELSIKVFPGIEVNLDGGHILIISDNVELENFNNKCLIIEKKIKHPTDSINIDELNQIFGDLEHYILIPHYEKKPSICGNSLSKIEHFISAGEVDSAKKFIRIWKDSNKLTPVLFSDVRISENLKNFPTRHTFVDCGDLTINTLKLCLKDKHKVSLSESDGNNLFQIFDNGQHLSTGLNVLIGGRSSGKTYTLNKIQETNNNIKYIKQFSLVQTDEDAYTRKFNNDIARDRSLFTEEYLKDFKSVVNELVTIDWNSNARQIDNYLNTLLKSAEEKEKKDAYSETTLFSETFFKIKDDRVLNDLISSVRQIIENKDFRLIIEQNIEINSMKKLACALIELLRKRHYESRKQSFVNNIIKNIKESLNLRSSATLIDDIDLYRIQIDKHKILKFIELTKNLKQPKEISRENIQGFHVVATKGPFEGAGDVKKISGLKVAFSDAFEKYLYPYKYLLALKEKESLSQSDFYKYFIKVDYKILNKDGNEVSGGERSEFRLLQKIKDAQNYEMLLIDEPESSFDNIFLKGEVNQIIKEISETMPVVVVTHNSTIGASIEPDYIIYSLKEYVDGKARFSLFSGYPMDRNLKSSDGRQISNFEVTINSLEAGSKAYEGRRKKYEAIKS